MKRPIKYQGKKITIDSFFLVIPWDTLEPIMGKRNTKNFLKWMNGQTCTKGGCYPSDLKAWLEHGINFD